MPKYVIDEGLETEEVIEAADARDDGIQWWFYDTQGKRTESRLKSSMETFSEVARR